MEAESAGRYVRVMSYTSLQFIIFVFIIAVVYYLLPVKKYQWFVLLAASHIFYFLVSCKAFIFILFTTVSSWGAGMIMDRIISERDRQIKENKTVWDRSEKKAYRAKIQKKLIAVLLITLVCNFGILIFLKYYNFMAGGLGTLLHHQFRSLSLLLPLGISFYTFQSMGYVIDIYNENINAQRNLLKYSLFISFFPQIVQGPISEYEQLGNQLLAERRAEYENIKNGVILIIWGFFKKLVIADHAVSAINTVTGDHTSYNGTTLLFILLLYAFQLYADFSAGIDISRGVCRILGIDMIHNFRRPYFSRSINEYWRRWHISLGAWMKKYIFYPFAMTDLMQGASKKLRLSSFGKTKAGAHIAKVLPAAVASLVVFLVVGLWHGANGKYVAFGLWNGFIIMLSILMEPVFIKITEVLHINVDGFVYRHFQMIRTLILVLIGYVFDIAPDFSGSIDMMRRMITDQDLKGAVLQIQELGPVRNIYPMLFGCMLLIWFISRRQEKLHIDEFYMLIDRHSAATGWLILFMLIIAILVMGAYGPGYNPADFVYMQF